MRTFLRVLLATLVLPPLVARPDPAPATLLNVSYDASGPFYEDLNKAFSKHWKAATGQEVTVTMAHGDSTREVRAILGGLGADVVTMDEPTGINLLAGNGLISGGWPSRQPNGSVPFTSTILFVVRKGNPKGIKDWDDLVRPEVRCVVSNPKTNGGGRCAYLSAWAYALSKNGNDQEKARDFVKKLFAHATVVDTGNGADVLTFAGQEVGDVLLTFENEAYTIQHDPSLAASGFGVVLPSLSIHADLPVATVEKNADAHGTRALCEAYLQFLYTADGQELAARHFLRPTDKDVLARHADVFKPIDTVDVNTVFGGWVKARETHFREGGIFDRISRP